MMNRRYDIDWVRVIAIGLLLIYHVAIGFQPWGMMIAFITNKQSWPSLWMPMTMLNVWRIPLLFFVSGMGVYFAMQRRSLFQLIKERTMRIFVPFVVGIFCIVPVHMYLWKSYYSFGADYSPGSGHLWFLGNIFTYVIILVPIFYLIKKIETGRVVQFLKKVMGSPFGIIIVTIALVIEDLIIKPSPYELYASNAHGFFLGMIAFFFGFLFVFSGEDFWKMILKWRWLFLSMAVIFYTLRTFGFQWGIQMPRFTIPVESINWILSVLAFGYRYLNKPGRILSYLSQAAYPVYILHMIFLYLGSAIIFKVSMPVEVQFLLVLAFTLAGCFLTYEIIRRIKLLQLLFGLKVEFNKQPTVRAGAKEFSEVRISD